MLIIAVRVLTLYPEHTQFKTFVNTNKPVLYYPTTLSSLQHRDEIESKYNSKEPELSRPFSTLLYSTTGYRSRFWSPIISRFTRSLNQYFTLISESNSIVQSFTNVCFILFICHARKGMFNCKSSDSKEFMEKKQKVMMSLIDQNMSKFFAVSLFQIMNSSIQFASTPQFYQQLSVRVC